MKSLILALLVASSSPAYTQENCGTLDQLGALVNKHGETLITSGQLDEGVFLATFANLETGTFTTVIMTADSACIAAAGGDFKHHLGNGA